jgi:hypothetical protein
MPRTKEKNLYLVKRREKGTINKEESKEEGT